MTLDLDLQSIVRRVTVSEPEFPPDTWERARQIGSLLSGADQEIADWLDLAESDIDDFFDEATDQWQWFTPEEFGHETGQPAPSPVSLAIALLRQHEYIQYVDSGHDAENVLWSYSNCREAVGLPRLTQTEEISLTEKAEAHRIRDSILQFHHMAAPLDDHAVASSMRVLLLTGMDGYQLMLVPSAVFTELAGTRLMKHYPVFRNPQEWPTE